MSLIIACASREFLIVVADQRLLIWPSGRNPWEIQDGHNKVVGLGGLHSIFSYAGVGKLGDKYVDSWVAETLSRRGEGLRSIPFITAVEEIRSSASQ